MCKQILLIDDTAELMTQIFDVLDMEGYYVSTAENGELGLKLLVDMKADLIITDLIMPRLDGFQFISQVRKNENWKFIPILIFSAMPLQNCEVKATALGANSFLKKPSTIESLLIAVNNLVYNEETD